MSCTQIGLFNNCTYLIYYTEPVVIVGWMIFAIVIWQLRGFIWKVITFILWSFFWVFLILTSLYLSLSFLQAVFS